MAGRTRILYILIAFVASVLLWIYVVGVENPQKEDVISGVPVTFIGVDEIYEDYDLMMTSEKHATVDLTVMGSIRDIAELNTHKESITVEADLSRYNSAGTKQVNYTVTIPDEDVTLLDQSPYYLNVTLENVITTAVEVRLRNDGSVSEGFITKTPTIEPASILVTGPRELVSGIGYAEAVWTRQNVDSTITADVGYSLYTDDGELVESEELNVNYETVNVTMPVQKMKTLPLSVKIVGGAGAAETDAKWTIDPAEIEVAGEPSIVDALNSVDVGSIDLADVLGTAEFTFPISLPNGVESLSGEGECSVSVTLEGLSVKSIVCDNIVAINQPEGLAVNVITNERSITLRGRAEDIDGIEPLNLRVVADLRGTGITESGRYTVDADVYVDGFPDVGVLGEYNVSVELMPEDEAGE